MEYKSNSFNLSDIQLQDVDHLNSYLSSKYEQQSVKNIMLGPNLISLCDISLYNSDKYNEDHKRKKRKYNEENKKLLNAVSRLLQHNLSSYKEQIYCISCENFYSGRKALKNIVNELEFVLVEKMISNLQDKFFDLRDPEAEKCLSLIPEYTFCKSIVTLFDIINPFLSFFNLNHFFNNSNINNCLLINYSLCDLKIKLAIPNLSSSINNSLDRNNSKTISYLNYTKRHISGFPDYSLVSPSLLTLASVDLVNNSIHKNIHYNLIKNSDNTSFSQSTDSYININNINNADNSLDEFNINNNNSLNIFYMLMFSFTEDELKYFLLCQETEEYFNYLSEEIPKSNNINNNNSNNTDCYNTTDNEIKRFLFINSFKILKNNSLLEELTSNNVTNNLLKIKLLSSTYQILFSQFNSNLKKIGMNSQEIFQLYKKIFSLILIGELNINKDKEIKRLFVDEETEIIPDSLDNRFKSHNIMIKLCWNLELTTKLSVFVEILKSINDNLVVIPELKSHMSNLNYMIFRSMSDQTFSKIISYYIESRVGYFISNIISFARKQSCYELNKKYSIEDNENQYGKDGERNNLNSFSNSKFLGKNFEYSIYKDLIETLDSKTIAYNNNNSSLQSSPDISNNNKNNNNSNNNISDISLFSYISLFISRESYSYNSVNKYNIINNQKSNSIDNQNNRDYRDINNSFNNTPSSITSIANNNIRNKSNIPNITSNSFKLEDDYFSLITNLYQELKQIIILNNALTINSSSCKDFIWPKISKNESTLNEILNDNKLEFDLKHQLFTILTSFTSNLRNNNDNNKISNIYYNHFNVNMNDMNSSSNSFNNYNLENAIRNFLSRNYNSSNSNGSFIRLIDDTSFSVKHFLNFSDSIEISYNFSDFCNINRTFFSGIAGSLVKSLADLSCLNKNSLVINQYNTIPIYVNYVEDIVRISSNNNNKDIVINKALVNSGPNKNNINNSNKSSNMNNYSLYNPCQAILLYTIYKYYKLNYIFYINIKEIKQLILSSNNNNNNGNINNNSISNFVNFNNTSSNNSNSIEDQIFIYNNILKKFKCNYSEIAFEKQFLIAKNSFNKILENNKNLSSLIFKYNHKMFYYLLSKKHVTKNYSKLKLTINSVLCFLKLTKIYSEKKIFKQVSYLLTDMITEQYEIPLQKCLSTILPNNQENQFSGDYNNEYNDNDNENKDNNFNYTNEIDENNLKDQVSQYIIKKNNNNNINNNYNDDNTYSHNLPSPILNIVFDFKTCSTLQILLPKFHSYLTMLTQVWKHYLHDVFYLHSNKNLFNKDVSKLIAQRINNIKTIIFLFNLEYHFDNLTSIRGVLHSQFIKSIVKDFSVLKLIANDIIEVMTILGLKDLLISNQVNNTLNSYSFNNNSNRNINNSLRNNNTYNVNVIENNSDYSNDVSRDISEDTGNVNVFNSSLRDIGKRDVVNDSKNNKNSYNNYNNRNKSIIFNNKMKKTSKSKVNNMNNSYSRIDNSFNQNNNSSTLQDYHEKISNSINNNTFENNSEKNYNDNITSSLGVNLAHIFRKKLITNNTNSINTNNNSGTVVNVVNKENRMNKSSSTSKINRMNTNNSINNINNANNVNTGLSPSISMKNDPNSNYNLNSKKFINYSNRDISNNNNNNNNNNYNNSSTSFNKKNKFANTINSSNRQLISTKSTFNSFLNISNGFKKSGKINEMISSTRISGIAGTTGMSGIPGMTRKTNSENFYIYENYENNINEEQDINAIQNLSDTVDIASFINQIKRNNNTKNNNNNKHISNFAYNKSKSKYNNNISNSNSNSPSTAYEIDFQQKLDFKNFSLMEISNNFGVKQQHFNNLNNSNYTNITDITNLNNYDNDGFAYNQKINDKEDTSFRIFSNKYITKVSYSHNNKPSFNLDDFSESNAPSKMMTNNNSSIDRSVHNNLNINNNSKTNFNNGKNSNLNTVSAKLNRYNQIKVEEDDEDDDYSNNNSNNKDVRGGIIYNKLNEKKKLTSTNNNANTNSITNIYNKKIRNIDSKVVNSQNSLNNTQQSINTQNTYVNKTQNSVGSSNYYKENLTQMLDLNQLNEEIENLRSKLKDVENMDQYIEDNLNVEFEYEEELEVYQFVYH